MQARVPARFQDLSEFRQIPDNQEVLADGHVDQSIVVELLELKADVADAQAATWFFLDLCREQDSEEAQCEVESVCELAQGQVPHLEQTSSSNNTGIGSNNNMGMDSSMNSGIASNVNSGIASNVNSAIDPNMNSGSIFKACAVGRMLVSKSREGLEAGNLVRCYLAVIRLRGVGTDLLVSLYDPLVISESSSSAEALGAGPVSQNGTGARSAKEVFETLLATLQINDWGLFGA